LTSTLLSFTTIYCNKLKLESRLLVDCTRCDFSRTVIYPRFIPMHYYEYRSIGQGSYQALNYYQTHRGDSQSHPFLPLYGDSRRVPTALFSPIFVACARNPLSL